MDVLSGIMTTFMNYCYAFTQNVGYPSYGVAIIMLTLIIKLVLAPLTAKQIRSMEGMQTLQPKIKELQKKYKGNQKKMQEEMTKLYREMGVNPLSGCLPILIQMPFLIAIFYALREYPYDPAFESFLWLPSLGQPDPTYIMPVLSAVSTYFIQNQMSGTQVAASDAQAKQQKIMKIVMPLFIGWISLNFPSGLVIYWVVSNVFQWAQQFLMTHLKKKEHDQKHEYHRNYRKTIEDAVRSGLVRLGRMKDEVDIEVLEEPKSGFFGFGSKPAKVRITEKKAYRRSRPWKASRQPWKSPSHRQRLNRLPT